MARAAGEMLYGAVEAGGTKFVCVVGSGPDAILEQAVLPTRRPTQTLAAVAEFFADAQRTHGALHGLGIGSFGPADLKPSSPTFGHILSTPKAGWSMTDMVGPLRHVCAGGVAFDTDVNAAGVGEAVWGVGRGLDLFIYVTVGTGIGGGAIYKGEPVHGATHGELGHVRPRRVAGDGDFPGICPFHGDCLEGLASGPAIKARWGAPLNELPSEHPAYEMQAHYLGELCAMLIFTQGPQRIVLGGGVSKAPGLIELVRARTRERIGGYAFHPLYGGDLREVITPPDLGDRAGVLGALALAIRKQGESCHER